MSSSRLSHTRQSLLPDFERLRAKYQTDIREKVDDVLRSLAKLDRSLQEAVAVSQEFKDVEQVWRSFYDPMLIEKLEEEEKELPKTPEKAAEKAESTPVKPKETENAQEANSEETSFQFEGRM